MYIMTVKCKVRDSMQTVVEQAWAILQLILRLLGMVSDLILEAIITIQTIKGVQAMVAAEVAEVVAAVGMMAMAGKEVTVRKVTVGKEVVVVVGKEVMVMVGAPGRMNHIKSQLFSIWALMTNRSFLTILSRYEPLLSCLLVNLTCACFLSLQFVQQDRTIISIMDLCVDSTSTSVVIGRSYGSIGFIARIPYSIGDTGPRLYAQILYSTCKH
jgi:hypothetical protein